MLERDLVEVMIEKEIGRNKITQKKIVKETREAMVKGGRGENLRGTDEKEEDEKGRTITG